MEQGKYYSGRKAGGKIIVPGFGSAEAANHLIRSQAEASRADRPLRAREANLPIRNPTEANREGHPPGKGGKSPDPESNGGKPGRSSPPGALNRWQTGFVPSDKGATIRSGIQRRQTGKVVSSRGRGTGGDRVRPSVQGRQIIRSGIQRRQTGKPTLLGAGTGGRPGSSPPQGGTLPIRNLAEADREGRPSGGAEPVADRVRLHREKKEGRRGLARRQEKQVNLLSPEPKAARRRGRRAKGRNPKAAFPPEVFQVHWNLLFQHCRRPNRLAFRPSAKLLLFPA